MATAEQYADWIVKNQSLKGTPEFETVAEAYKVARAEPVAAEQPMRRSSDIKDTVHNSIGGFLAGAAGIGENIISAATYGPRLVEKGISKLTGEPMLMNDAVNSMQQGNAAFINDNKDSTAFQVGKIGAEIAGTAGAGNVLGLGARAANMPKLASALESGGFSLNAPAATTKLGKVANAATRVAGGAAGGAATAGMIDPDNIKTGAVIGGAFPVAGKIAGETGRFLGKSIAGQTSKEITDLAAKAEKLGIDIPADRLTNSKPLNAVAASLNYVPFSGRAQTEQQFEKQLNTALSKTFGQNTDNITSALRKASDDLGHKFDNTLKSNTVSFDKQFLDDIVKTQNQAVNELSDQGMQVINRQIDDIVKKGETGLIDGQAAYNIKRTLDRIGKGNTPEAYHARQLKKDLMSALDRSLGAKGAKEFAKVRKQYGTMLDLENIAQNGAEGGISIARLANMKNINNPELQDLADIAAQFLKPRESQHGAMQRVAIGGVAGSTAGLPALAAGAVGGRLANKALNSKVAKNIALGKTKTPKVNNNLIASTRAIPIAAIYD